MAEGCDSVDKACREVFGKYVEKEAAKQLSQEEKKIGSGTTVRKILKEVLGYSNAEISQVEASILSKHLVKKKITVDVFMNAVLPELAAKKPKAGDTEKLKSILAKKLEDLNKDTKTKNAAVVDRLTDAKGYTGCHGQRFDKETGKGLGKTGREDVADNSGYVQGYGNKDTYGCKK